MNRSRLIVALLIGLLAAGAAAQEKGKKLYRWVDKDGKVHFSDALPPEAIDQARREFDSDSGAATGSVDRAPTAEELAQAAASATEAASAAELERRQRQQEEAMLASYTTEDDLRRSYDERIALLKQTLATGEVGILSQRATLVTLLNDAAETELAERPLDAKRAQTIREMHAELINQQGLLVRREAELATLGQEYERTLARYRELRQAEATPPADAAATDPLATPPAAAPPAAAPPEG